MADPTAAPDGSDAADDDDECEGVAYMFDAAAATERRSLALDHGAVRSSAKMLIFDFIGFFIIKSERIFLVLQREQTDLVELCFKHL